jgi:hypothetical protein
MGVLLAAAPWVHGQAPVPHYLEPTFQLPNNPWLGWAVIGATADFDRDGAQELVFVVTTNTPLTSAGARYLTQATPEPGSLIVEVCLADPASVTTSTSITLLTGVDPDLLYIDGVKWDSAVVNEQLQLSVSKSFSSSTFKTTVTFQ